MPFVKLDCGILESSLWVERDVRDVFITALLLAKPQKFFKSEPQLQIRSLKPTGWKVPPGEYGFVRAASTGIIDRAKVERLAGLKALETLGSPEAESRSPQFDGRRIVRVAGGFVVLNYMRYRGQDDTNAERQARYRLRHSNAVTTVTEPLLVTQADADVDVERRSSFSPDRDPPKDRDHVSNGAHAHGRDLFAEFWACYPKHVDETAAESEFMKLKVTPALLARMISTLGWQVQSHDWTEKNGRYIPHAAKWLRGERWKDEKPKGAAATDDADAMFEFLKAREKIGDRR